MIFSIPFILQGCTEDNVQEDDFTNLPIYQLEEMEVLSDQADLLMGRPVFTEIDSEGNRLIMDLSSFEILVYDEQGTYHNSFGREGSGPGEFQQPSYMMLGENDTLYVSDNTRNSLIVYSKSSDFSWSHAYDIAFPQAENGYPGSALMPSTAGFPIVYMSNDESDEFPNGFKEVRIVDRHGEYIGNAGVKFKRGALITLEMGGNQIRLGLSEVPGDQISPKNDGSFYRAWTGDPVIYHYSSGGELLLEIHLPGLPEQEVTNAAISSLNDRLFGSQFGDMTKQLREEIGDTFPYFSQIRVMKDESLWLARIVPDSGNENWYHITAEGEPLGQLILDEGFRLRNSNGNEVYISGEKEDGAPAVIKYRLSKNEE